MSAMPKQQALCPSLRTLTGTLVLQQSAPLPRGPAQSAGSRADEPRGVAATGACGRQCEFRADRRVACAGTRAVQHGRLPRGPWRHARRRSAGSFRRSRSRSPGAAARRPARARASSHVRAARSKHVVLEEGRASQRMLHVRGICGDRPARHPLSPRTRRRPCQSARVSFSPRVPPWKWGSPQRRRHLKRVRLPGGPPRLE